MQKQKLTISKSIFYKDGRAFSETAPPSECIEHSVCGCTRYVAKQPENVDVGQIKISLSLNSVEQHDAFHKGELSIAAHLGGFYFYSDKIEEDTKRDSIWCCVGPFERHVYLFIHENRLRFEYYIPDYGIVDYMFVNVFRGNAVDRSTLMNGHSPPKIDTTVPTDHQLWSYVCFFGKEQFTLLSDDKLQQTIDLGNEMLDTLSKIHVHRDSEVEDIYKQVGQSGLQEQSAQIEEFMRNFDLRNHKIFDALHAADCAIHDQSSMFKGTVNNLL
jgi:hypothetical protein